MPSDPSAAAAGGGDAGLVVRRIVRRIAAAGRRGRQRSFGLLCLLWTPLLLAQEASLRESIADALVRPTDQRFVGYRWPQEPDIVALYYGADWCAPCHAFVPELKRIRDAMRAQGADTEVVYVSLDDSPRTMRRYMRRQQMPWPAIDHRRLPALPAIRALGGMAPPSLVLIDADGRVLDSSWDGRRYRGLQPVLETWLRRFDTAEDASVHAR